MKKRIIKVIAIALLVVISCTMNVPSIVYAQTQTINDGASASMTEYALDIAVKYIGSYGGDSSEEIIYLSQPYYIVNGDDCYSYFVFKGNSCVGVLNVVYIEGQYSSSYTAADLSTIALLQSSRDAFIIVSDGQNLYAKTADGHLLHVIGLSARSEVEISGNRHLQYQSLELTRLGTISARRSQYCVLNVPIVQNVVSPDTGEGICWAAAMASIIRYRAGLSSLTALEEYYLLRTYYPPTNYGYPNGSCDWICRSFSLPVHSLSYTHVHSGTYYDNVKNIVEVYGRPIYCWISNPNIAHSIVISGFDSGYGYYFYRIVDSNVANTVSVQVTNTLANNFTYTTTFGDTYNRWVCHMY